MKKRISLLACVLAASLSFAGCSGKDNTIKYEEAALEQVTETFIATFSQTDPQYLEKFKELSDFQLEMVIMQSNLPIEGEDLLAMIGSWQAAEDECGEYVDHEAYEVEVSDKDITVSTLAKFEDRAATIEFKFGEDLKLISMDVSAKYSIGEILKKAGLNTVLGMGTVFVVLIFLSFIISLFKYIPNGDKKAKEEKTSAAIPVPVESTTENLADDLELVAVITAAIAASEGTSTDGFVVRSIKRRRSNNWN